MLRGVVVFLALVVVVVPTMQLASPLTVGFARASTDGVAVKALSGARTLVTTLEPPTVPLFVAVTNMPSAVPHTITPGFSADPFVPPRA